jgi:hypothetical protein
MVLDCVNGSGGVKFGKGQRVGGNGRAANPNMQTHGSIKNTFHIGVLDLPRKHDRNKCGFVFDPINKPVLPFMA